MMFYEAFLAPTPKSFQTVNIDLARTESFAMVYFEVTVAAKHETVIAPEFVGIDNATTANSLDG